ncbi:hypothetical protein K488DRAFT_76908 [Vararia minispora EC-137]|uniref:Uncharacterized protein n=1 Tax=Vararia minispora EC-137 TaxID=1314806 RepID=A0ACB8QT65_9AGAM|nr:hypothetical protein K488DRAFT_76908 [Vararia minispora EC-137]
MVAAQEPDTARSWRPVIIPYLTNITQATAPFLTTFVLVHLAAPVMANVGGSSMSSQVMLLGREYYQTSFGERYLLLTPLIAHIGSATLKRIISPRPPRAWTSSLTITGYTLAFLALPMHFLTHRWIPADPSPPIHAFGPAELDYEFVKFGLSMLPLRSWVGYGLLATFAVTHLVEGVSILQRTNGMKGITRRARRTVAAAVLLPVLSGIVVLAREPLLVFGPLAERYRAVYDHVPPFKL